MLRYIKRHSILALMALCISIITQITAPVSTVLEQNMIDSIVQGDMECFREILWYVALIALATGVAYYLKALTENRFKARFTEDLRNDLYDGIMRKEPAYFQAQDTAEYISMINNDVDTLTTNFSSPIWTLAGTGFSTVFSLFIMLLYSPLLAAVAVLCSFLSFLVPMIFTKQMKKKLVEKTVYQADLSVRLKEALNGHDVISAFGVFSQIRIRFSEANKALTNSYYKFTLLLSGLENCSAVIGKVIKFITFLIAGGMAIKGQISIGTVILFVSLYGFFSSGGVDGECGEDGANLSGGQKQRIALARALVRGIDFLILDEGVSAIDVETANEIEKELLGMENLTLLTITHRIKDGLLGCYDRVLSMDEGKMAER